MPKEDANKYISNRLDTRIVLLILLLSCLLGGNAVATKIALGGITPFMNAGLRAAIGTIGIIIWGLLSKQRIIPERREISYLIFAAFILLGWLCTFNIGIRFTLASRASVFLNTRSVFATILAHFFIPGDRLSYRKAMGLGIAFVGIIIIFWNKMAGISPLGDSIVLISGFLLASRAIYIKRISQHIEPNKILIWEMALALVPFFALSLIFEKPYEFTITPAIILAILYQGILVAAFSGVVWILLLKRYMASRLSIFLFATPIFGVILSSLILHDPITIHIFIGTLLVASGIYVVSKCSKGFGVCG